MVKENYLGKNTRYLRTTYLEMPLKEMAERLDISSEQLSRIEHGRYSMIAIDNLLNIADIFGIDLETLIRKDLSKSAKEELNKKFRLHDFIKKVK